MSHNENVSYRYVEDDLRSIISLLSSKLHDLSFIEIHDYLEREGYCGGCLRQTERCSCWHCEHCGRKEEECNCHSSDEEENEA